MANATGEERVTNKSPAAMLLTNHPNRLWKERGTPPSPPMPRDDLQMATAPETPAR